jgi:DNA-nicking Smr family endonuclease
MARRRALRPEEEELWRAVARTARAMHVNGGVFLKPVEHVLHPVPQTAEPAHLQPAPRLPLFRLGEKSRVSTTHSLVPAPVAALQMDAKTHSRMTKGKLTPDVRIDLHGMTLAEAHPELIAFILSAQSAGLRLVLVITGKGKGKRGLDIGPIPQRMGALRHQVPQWLRLPPLGPAVLQVAEAHLRHGGSGAFYVYLRRGR